MKKTVLILSVLLTLLLTVVPATAQSKTIVSANIPFEFYVDNLKFPAGTYYFETMRGGTAHNYLRIVSRSGVDSHFRMTAEMAKDNPIKEGSVRFELQNGRAYLQLVSAMGEAHAHIMTPRILPTPTTDEGVAGK